MLKTSRHPELEGRSGRCDRSSTGPLWSATGEWSRFRRATSELLESRALLRRTDTKFLFARSRLDELLRRLRDDYALLYAADEPIATYQTLYFDTPDHRCFHDHRRGRRSRHKVRVRHYLDRQCTYLEVKTKNNHNVTSKVRLKREFLAAEIGAEGREYITPHLPFSPADLVPQIWTNFSRLTLLGLHTHERLTIDVGLTFRDADHAKTEPGQRPLHELVIIEVKQARFTARTPAMLALRAQGSRPHAASKYCSGMILARGAAPANRFLPTLRTMKGISRCST